MKLTEYGKLLLTTQRDANLLAVASLQIQAAMTKNKELVLLAESLGDSVRENCKRINEAIK